MSLLTRSLWLGLMMVIAAGSFARIAAGQPAAGMSREAVEQIIREYLVEHPEVIADALRVLEQRRGAAARQKQSEALRTRQTELLRDPAAPVAGNPAGDVTVVEFFDYRCGYCKNVRLAVKKLLGDDPNVRLVFKELPILGPDSVMAARAALAAKAQDKYLAMHEALMGATGALTRPIVLELAKQAGLDAARLDKDMESPEILQVLRRNHELAEAIGITGTPAFVVGTEVAPGAVDLATLKRMVEQARRR